MIKLGVFSRSDLQNCLQLLNEFEADGVVDIRFVRQRLYEHISAGSMVVKVAARKEKRSARKCPSCGRGVLLPVASIDGLYRIGCNRCYYSELVK